MAMEGNLEDMAVADLIQHNCQDRKTARLTVQRQEEIATIFFDDGAVKHAALGDTEGEEVIYELLQWQEGCFALELGPTPPAINIERSWSGLLLEGAKRLDEARPDAPQNGAGMLDELAAPKKKSDKLGEALELLLTEAADIEAAAVVGTDGLVYAQKNLDEDVIGASAAAMIGLSKRSSEQLKRGNFKQTLIQGKDGNIIVAAVNNDVLLVGLTDSAVNMGITFSEVRMLVSEIDHLM